MSELYTVTPRQARTMISEIIQAGLVPFVQSSPGIGKSSIMGAIAEEYELKLIDHRLSTSAPEDLSGLPMFKDGMASFAPFAELFPLEDTPIPKGYQGWMLFLDEFNSASKSVQAASYKLILDRMTGQRKLHSHCVITAAGNLSSDRSIVNPLATAMQSRLIHLEMVVSFQEWLMDVALAENYDPRIIAFLNNHPTKLMDFRPDHQEKTFACPRTWSFMNALIKGKKVSKEMAPLYAGTLTSGIAVEFVAFTEMYDKLIPMSTILANPTTCQVPDNVAVKWATTSMILEHVNTKNFDKCTDYINRFSMDFRILFFRSIMVRFPELRQHPSFASSISSLIQYLN